MKKIFMAGVFITAIGASCRSGPATDTPLPQLPAVAPNSLRPLSDFAAISDEKSRSRALFMEVSRVITHPRCVNCHPNGDTPHQGERLAPHDPPVVRGPVDDHRVGHGVVGMMCSSCHQDKNVELTRVPGAPKWALAPIEMAWVGKTPHQICEQIKDKDRNGGKTNEQLIHHSAEDALVGWAWNPGADRPPAPGTQKEFGALFAAWIESGAECPAEERTQP